MPFLVIFEKKILFIRVVCFCIEFYCIIISMGGMGERKQKPNITAQAVHSTHTFRHTEIILSNDYQFPHSPIQQNTLNKSVANDHPGAPSSTQAPMATYGIIVPNISDKPNLHSLCKREPSVDILLFNTPTPLKLTHW